jgi:Na+/H+ antiporter NhaD/arsenite permease-like protein
MIPIIKEVHLGLHPGVDIMPFWWALSLGACLGANGSLLGTACNIVASNLTRDTRERITFLSYFKIGFPLMLLSIAMSAVYIFLRYYAFR